jgi:hypothetical protein
MRVGRRERGRGTFRRASAFDASSRTPLPHDDHPLVSVHLISGFIAFLIQTITTIILDGTVDSEVLPQIRTPHIAYQSLRRLPYPLSCQGPITTRHSITNQTRSPILNSSVRYTAIYEDRSTQPSHPNGKLPLGQLFRNQTSFMSSEPQVVSQHIGKTSQPSTVTA